MKFRMFACVASWAIALALVLTGAVTPSAGVFLAFAASASLCTVRPSLGRLAACPSPFDALAINTEWLPQTIYRKASQSNFWIGYIQAEEFPRNAGVNQTTFVIQNSEPYSNTEAWTEVTQANNIISTMCTQPYVDVDVGYEETNYSPRRINLAGPVICRETLMFAHNPGQFLEQYQMELVKRAKRTWEFELRNQALRLYAKGVCSTSFNILQDSDNFPNIVSNSQLTLDMLDETAQYLIESGATDADMEWVEVGPDGPIFPLVIGNLAAQRLYTNNDARREDVRFSDMGMGPAAELMKRIMATRVVRNFRVVPTVLPPRFNFTMGQYVQVNTYEQVNTTEGTGAIISSDYRNALYEAAIIPHPMAFKKAVVKPDNAGLSWSPINYMGDWTWLTGGNLISDTYCFDPMKNYGRHFAQFFYAPHPIYRNFGVALMYQVCPSDYAYAPCDPYYA